MNMVLEWDIKKYENILSFPISEEGGGVKDNSWGSCTLYHLMYHATLETIIYTV